MSKTNTALSTSKPVQVNYSDKYNEIRKSVSRWPTWKVNTYNSMVATSTHAKKSYPRDRF
jgi:hypothetical protein